MSSYLIHESNFLVKSMVEAIKMDLRVVQAMDHYQVILSLQGVVLKWTNLVTVENLRVEER